MFAVIGRVIVTVFAFLMAAVVTLFVLVTLGSERLTHAVQGADDVTVGAALELMGHAVALISTTPARIITSASSVWGAATSLTQRHVG